MKFAVLAASVLLVLAAVPTRAQTTDFVYQGSLQSGSAQANGSFDFEFALFDDNGLQIGPLITRNGVAVVNGIFSVNLNFGLSFTGSGRVLEIRVRVAGGGAFTTLLPRQSVASAPYSIKSISADNATTAATAITATNAATAANFSGTLSGDVTGTQGATTVARLQTRSVASTPPLDGQVLKYNSATSQWRPDTDNAGTGGGGGTITGVAAGTGLSGGGATGNVTLNIANGGVGTAQLADGSVTDVKINSVSGNKVTGTVANATTAATAINATNADNATNAATATNAVQLGGVAANQYLQTNGNGSGLTNLNASSISTGTLANARIGQIINSNIADLAVTGQKIAVGAVVKNINSLADSVTLAAGSNITITPSGNTLTFASTGGGNAVLNQTTQQDGANFNIGGTGTASSFNAVTQYNLGGARVLSTTGMNNLFAGVQAGASNTGASNAFFGAAAGAINSSGAGNSFFGSSAGAVNTTGTENAFFGLGAGLFNTTGERNSAVGSGAGRNTSVGGSNVFFGWNAGRSNETGSLNTFIGTDSGRNMTGTSENTFVGFDTANEGTDGGQCCNTVIGARARTARTVVPTTNSTAIGYRAQASRSNSLVLGAVDGINGGTGVNVGIGTTAPQSRLHIRASSGNILFGDPGCGPQFNGLGFGSTLTCSNYSMLGEGVNTFINRPAGGSIHFRSGNTDQVIINSDGTVRLNHLGDPTSTHLCFGALQTISFCSSSQRYKTDIRPYSGGLDLLQKFRPVEYTWKVGGKRDVGFIAEEVAGIEPLLTFTNQNGEIEGVQYAQITTILVNSIKEQQVQIEAQRKQIESLAKAVCLLNSKADICPR